MKRLFTAAMLLVITTISANAQLVINELMQSNVECIMDDIHEFPDSWVELYNSGTTPVNLKDYKISNKNKEKKAWQLPNITLDPDSFIIIYCDKEARTDKRLHTDFRLESGDGCLVYLFKNKEVVDSLPEALGKMPAPDVAYGRKTDGADEWGYQLTPSAGKANTGKICDAEHILGAPKFSESGRVTFGNDTITLELSLPEDAPPGAYITYTTHGSEPTADSTKYENAIEITKTKVIRAKVFCDGWLSPVSTAQSYIFHPRDITVPIFSVQTDDKYLNGADSLGLFRYNTKKEDKKTCDWRRPVNIEFFPKAGKPSAFNQLGETRIQGGQSRANALKSMVFYANKRFDPNHKRFDYEFFPDQKPGITEFNSFSLRDGGNDFGELYFRDLIIQRTMGKNTDLDWQAGHTAVLYINGEYMGMLNIRERSNEDNIASNYDGLEDIDMIEIGHEKVNNVDQFIEEQKEGTDSFYNAFKAFYSQEAVQSLADYEQWLDVSEYLNVMVLNLFYGNIDFPGNNLVFWRPNEKAKENLPKRFRVIVKDTDYGLGLYGWDETKSSFNTIHWIYDPSTNPDGSRSSNSWAFSEPATRLFRNMMKNQDIKNMFIDKSCIFMGDFMNGKGTGEMIDSIKAEAMEEFVAHRDKYNPGSYWYGHWYPADNRTDITNRFSAAKSWAESRPNNFIQHMSTQWNLGTAIPVTINMNDNNQPIDNLPDSVYINGIKLTKSVFDGKLFPNRQIKLVGKTNVENDLIITGWEVKKNGVSERIDETTYTFNMDNSYQNLSIKAIMCEDPRVKVIIGPYGAASFSSTKALDFTDQPVNAYIVTAKNGNSFIKEQVYRVPANTGLIVEGAKGTYKIPVAESSSYDDIVSKNLLLSTASAAVTVPNDDRDVYFGLFYSYDKKMVGFKKIPANETIAKGKSYLCLTQQQAKEITEFFFDEIIPGVTTTIKGVNNNTWTDGKAYNLNGQRVDKNYKGVIIVNGKKVVNNRK